MNDNLFDYMFIENLKRIAFSIKKMKDSRVIIKRSDSRDARVNSL